MSTKGPYQPKLKNNTISTQNNTTISCSKSHNRENTWVRNGVSSWSKMKSVGMQKKGKLSVYFSSKDHRETIAILAQFSDPYCPVDVLVDRSCRTLYILRRSRMT
ncbi:unnamed protein product [Lepeophtheirus salmonis]|uniref:(salmon louse) hypothetical protein n=1 Tax=Lepeophtheirus salmonis TaxID=72036 RepID=A0A7R8D2B5_LEPSM|nr:unnamed protein product [Lepeophtheirus salmonis]CAF3003831.1 unnamed protein product [Lepeophtheirus salmonis]